ncbi:MAG: OmpA family protein [Myxococcota bacterium]
MIRAGSFVALALLLVSCQSASGVQGRIDGLRDVLEQAERNGAYRCAPRELALGKAHLEFASDELEQGNAREAQSHYLIAEPNARAAFRLSPAARCSPREVVVHRRPEPAPGDRDGDTFLDPDDECPDDPEDFDAFEDEDGCPDDQDSDGDGIPDSRDLCVAEPEDADGRGDADGCPDLDDDLDGVPDTQDACVIEPEDRDGFRDEDGCPDPDNDGDSTVDVTDNCPDEPGPADENGCPRVYQNVQVTQTEIRITQKVHFAFNRATILRDSFELLNTVAQVLRDFPEVTVEIQGHTDSRGSDRYNQRLSNQRAEAVRDYLLRQGIEPSRMTARGYGESRPIESNNTNAGRAANRRVQFVRTDAAAEQFRSRAVP